MHFFLMQGFVAKPTVIDGRLNLLIWDCLVPGKKNVSIKIDL